MNALVAALELALAALAVVYVQAMVGSRTSRAWHAWLVRALLLVLGAAVGLTALDLSPAVPGWLAFAIGFGFVHLPPAVVLFLKRQRPPRTAPPR